MASRRNKRRGQGEEYDFFALLLAVAAFGLAIMPVILIAGGKSSSVIACMSVYGGVVAVVAPLYARRLRDRRSESDGDDSSE